MIYRLAGCRMLLLPLRNLGKVIKHKAYSVFYAVENERVIVMRVLYSASNISIRLKG